MAMQIGVGLSKVIILFGAGYAGTILLKNGKLSDAIRELQALVKGLEQFGGSASADSDPVAAQGLSFSDLMYVTKHNMETAEENLITHLESVSYALAKPKKHLTQWIERVDVKVDDMKDIPKLIQNDVSDVRLDLSRIYSELHELKDAVSFLDNKMNSMDDKMNLTLDGVDYLCQFIDGRKA